MAQSRSIISPETTKASSTSHPPLPVIQAAPEHKTGDSSAKRRTIQDDVLQMQRLYGNSYVGELIQAKIDVSQPGDAYEQEAHRMVNKMINLKENKLTPYFTPTFLPKIQRQEKGGKTEESWYRVYSDSETNESNDYVVAGISQKIGDKTEHRVELVKPREKYMPPKGWDFDCFIRRDGTGKKFGGFIGWESELTAEKVKLEFPQYIGEAVKLFNKNPKPKKLQEKQPVLQRAANSLEPFNDVHPLINQVLRSNDGYPLNNFTRVSMESLFGYHFGDVRVHTDSSAVDAARQLSAQAFTIGRDIYFGSGRFQPQTQEGQGLLVHELTHVVQQRSGLVAPGMKKPMLGTPGDVFEREADAVASQVMAGQPVLARAISGMAIGGHALIARQAEAETPPPEAGSPETPSMAEEPFEGANALAARSSELHKSINDLMMDYANAWVDQDAPWLYYMDLKLALATSKREAFLVDFYSVNPGLWISRGEDASDVLVKAYDAATTEETTIALLQEEGLAIEDILNGILLEMPELFPEYTIGLYRSAVKELQAQADSYRERFNAEFARLVQRPVEEIVPDFVWIMQNWGALEWEAGYIDFFTWLDFERPVFLERRDPNSTRIGINDVRIRLNEHRVKRGEFIHPGLRERLSFLYPPLEAWYFYNLYDQVAQQMDLFRIGVGATYERLNEFGSMPDLLVELRDAYHAQAPQVFHDVMRQGFRTIAHGIENVLDNWVAGLSWHDRIREGFGLYDVFGEIGTQLRAMVTPEGIAMMVGFIAFLIAIQFVPLANIVVDAILIVFGAIEILKGVGIFGYYFDQASEARTFRELYYAAQGLRGGGETILNLLFQLVGLAAARAIRAYARYRGVKKIESLDEIADHEIIRRGTPEVRKAFEEARAAERALEVFEMIKRGHTIELHGPQLARAELAERILKDLKIDNSTRWLSEDLLVKTVNDVLASRAQEIRNWLRQLRVDVHNASPPKLERIPVGRTIGEGYIRRLGKKPIKAVKKGEMPEEIAVEWFNDLRAVTIVLRPDGPQGFYVLTAHPTVP